MDLETQHPVPRPAPSQYGGLKVTVVAFLPKVGVRPEELLRPGGGTILIERPSGLPNIPIARGLAAELQY